MSPRRCLSLLVLLISCSAIAQQKGYYRTPTIYQNTVIFTAEGDLWKYDLASGITSRLTTNPGMEIYPVISPDGKEVAFTGNYEGSPDLYVMNIDGGVPRRITYDLSGAFAASWTSDGKILYSTPRYSLLPVPQLVKVDPKTQDKQIVPLSQADGGVYDKDGVLYFVRLPNQGSKTKRYKGGFIQQIWKFDGTHEAVNLTGDFDGTSANPMLYNGRIFFLSDRDGTMNLWSMDKDGKNLKQHTFSKGWDLHDASNYDSKIVYQKGADLCLYDASTNTEKTLDIHLLSDFDQRKPKWIKSSFGGITYADISPSGNYVAVISRGRLFVSPAKSDRWVEVSRKSGIRYKEVHFITDKSLAVVSDESGEYEIWKVNADGSEQPKQITHNTKPMFRSIAASPDGKFIGYIDQNDVVRIVETASGSIKFEYDKAYQGTGQVGWSPDSRFLNFTQGLANDMAQVCLVDVQTMKMTPVTTSRLNSYGPAWSADTNWLYYISERNLHTLVGGPWGARQPEPYYTETNNIYAIPLDTSAKFPFLATDSWLTDSLFNPVPKSTAGSKGKSKSARSYDWELLKSQLYQVPIKSANIGAIDAASGYLYWIDNGPDGNENGGRLLALKIGESKKYDPTEVATGVRGFDLSANRKKILVRYKNNNIAVDDANGQKIDADKSKLDLENWSFVVNPTEEWHEIFVDAWRMERDYFYDRDLHKVDWVAVRQRYEPLVDRITDRSELNDLIAQMVGELSALHTFVGGGDQRRSPDQIAVGSLGARLRKDPKGALIEHIYRTDPDYPELASPLNRPELHIKDGDIITAVNNVPLDQVSDISVLLENKVGMPVKLSLLTPEGQSRDEVVKPISYGAEYGMRYGEWELTRRQKVDSASNGDIGYVHLRAMGDHDMDDFVKQFYPIYNKKGLILDVRHNFGGNIDSWVLEKLMRKAWMYWQGRSGGPTWNMQDAFRGHMVILCDQITSSDGEAVTEGFRRLGLGKVIGMRTWGGEIWLSFDNWQVDNGIASAAETGVFGPEGKWLIEGHGVDPDIVVDNMPHETFLGKDAQLQTAIDYLKKLIIDQPVPDIKVPQHPDKSFKYSD